MAALAQQKAERITLTLEENSDCSTDACSCGHHHDADVGTTAGPVCRLARAKQRRPTAGRQEQLQSAGSGSSADGAVAHDSVEVAQQARSTQSAAVTGHQSSIQSTAQGSQNEPVAVVDINPPGNAEQSASISVQRDTKEQSEFSAKSTAAAADDTVKAVVDVPAIGEQQVTAENKQQLAVELTTDSQSASLDAPQAQLIETLKQEKTSVAEAEGAATGGPDVALEAYLSHIPSAKTPSADDEVLAMNVAGVPVSSAPDSENSKTSVAKGGATCDDNVRLAKLAQETEALRAKMAAAIARIRSLEAEKALAARELAAASSTTQVCLLHTLVIAAQQCPNTPMLQLVSLVIVVTEYYERKG